MEVLKTEKAPELKTSQVPVDFEKENPDELLNSIKSDIKKDKSVASRVTFFITDNIVPVLIITVVFALIGVAATIKFLIWML